MRAWRKHQRKQPAARGVSVGAYEKYIVIMIIVVARRRATGYPVTGAVVAIDCCCDLFIDRNGGKRRNGIKRKKETMAARAMYGIKQTQP